MVVQLDQDLWFPNPNVGEPDGLLAVGGDLSVDRLLLAYSYGIFPWYSFRDRKEILWYCPLERFVIFPDEVHVSHSMRTLMNKHRYRLSINENFEGVINECSRLRYEEEGAWLGEDMIAAYTELHRQGFASSVEVWEGERLVGGLYGVTMDKVFIGESMFSLVPSASKLALIHLARTLSASGRELIDCQLETQHLRSMGGRFIPYDDYLEILNPEYAESKRQRKRKHEKELKEMTNKKLKIEIEPCTFHFRQPAGTSRGVYTERRSWLLKTEPGGTVGECAPLPNLSCDDIPDYEKTLRAICDLVEETGKIPYELLRPYPSMLFGLETALLPMPPVEGGGYSIPINGLVWMGSHEEMVARMEEKLKQGFHCVKLKIGAIDFEEELDLIKRVRQRFSSDVVELRVDANGGFRPDDALQKLEQLSKYDIHSIEQPLPPYFSSFWGKQGGAWIELARLCRETPLPIALDEELIGVNHTYMKQQLLDQVKPQYIILKPSLHGGMRGAEEWITLARERGIGSWVTSALESNIGLYAIARFAERMYGPDIKMPQGLGTGLLFTDNIPMPLEVKGERLFVLA